MRESVGIVNEHSIATGCAQAFRREEADRAVTCLNEKTRPFVQPVAEVLEAEMFLLLNVTADGQTNSFFRAIAAKWGRLDFVLHLVAYCPQEDLQCPVKAALGACVKYLVAELKPAGIRVKGRPRRLNIPQAPGKSSALRSHA